MAAQEEKEEVGVSAPAEDIDSDDEEAHFMPPEASRRFDDASNVAEGCLPPSQKTLGEFLGDEQTEKFTEVFHVRLLFAEDKNPKFVKPNGDLKARRANPIMWASEFLASLQKVGEDWIFPGSINGWAAYAGCKLKSITCSERGALLGLGKKTTSVWTEGEGQALPELSMLSEECRATMAAPSWMRFGWAADCPGFVFWFSDQVGGRPRMIAGTQAFSVLDEDAPVTQKASVTNVHCFAYRYPRKKETLHDRQVWHTALALEWSHGLFMTTVELAFLDGCSAIGGKADWVEDKTAAEPIIKTTFWPGMLKPYNSGMSEIRMMDVPARDRKEFEAFIEKYTGKDGLPLAEQRFLEPTCYATGTLKMRRCTPADLFTYCHNYIGRVPAYMGILQNCQTFAVDLYAFLTGSRHALPLSPFMKAQYKQRLHAFLYEVV